MSTLGESLTQEEIDEMIREADRYGEHTTVYIFTTGTLLGSSEGKEAKLKVYKCVSQFWDLGCTEMVNFVPKSQYKKNVTVDGFRLSMYFYFCILFHIMDSLLTRKVSKKRLPRIFLLQKWGTNHIVPKDCMFYGLLSGL